MSMFCYQCQEAARGVACKVKGVCGKGESTAKLQDLLVYSTKSLAEIILKNNIDLSTIPKINIEMVTSLFITITNANFDDEAIADKINEILVIRDGLLAKNPMKNPHDCVTFKVTDMASMIEKGSSVGVLSTTNEDIRSLREMIVYGIKGMAAYMHHAENLKQGDNDIIKFMYEGLEATLNDTLTVDDLVALTLKTGEYGVKVMALLDGANTGAYGNPEITSVNIGVKNKPGILVTGHDLHDLEQLLEQTKDTGIDVYTHSEMLPAHYYPGFKKYDNLVGNYGGAWWSQLPEFESFNGPILFTTNCIVPPKTEEAVKRIFTTGASGFPGATYIGADENGKKDFTEIIELAKKCKPPTEIETGEIVGGFAHNQVFKLADKVVDAVKSGAIRKFVVMAGCDGRHKNRNYYTEFAEKLPKDVIILTAGCAKYRYNKLNLGDINGIPRVLDAGQCNDSYSLAVIALKLKEIFGVDTINELPICYNIAWYEQKAIIVLLALLYLGVKDIHVGPTLPAFLSPNVTKVLVENFGISGIDTVDKDIAMFFGEE